MAKTYVPELRHLVNRMCRYTSRWDLLIRPGLTAAQLSAYITYVAACELLRQQLGTEPLET